MQAKNGSSAPGVRRGRFVGCLIALVALAAMAVPSAASASKITQTYVGLGDSLAFGYSQQTFNENLIFGEPASAYEKGFVSDYYNLVNTAGKIQAVNYGCPGETTESLIGNNPTLLATINGALAGKIPEPVTGEAPCAYHYAAGLPLHNEYGGTKSQLEAALETIAVDKAAKKPVKAITLDIGSNDQLHEITKIKGEVKEQIEDKVEELAKAEGERAVQKKVHAETVKYLNANFIEPFLFFTFIKPAAEDECEDVTGDVGAGPTFCALEYPGSGHTYEEVFEGKYVAENGAFLKTEGEKYFAEHEAELEVKGFEFSVAYGAAHMEELEDLAEERGFEYAVEYQTVNAEELEDLGEELFAQTLTANAPGLFEQIVVNETGIIAVIKNADPTIKIDLVGAYNPYGNAYGSGELLPGSNALVNALNTAEATAFKKMPLKACYVNNHAVFNTETVPTETEHLLAWTNMHNTTEFEYEPGKKIKFNQPPVKVLSGPLTGLTISPDGPDIHATTEGYEVMAKTISTSCVF